MDGPVFLDVCQRGPGVCLPLVVVCVRACGEGGMMGYCKWVIAVKVVSPDPEIRSICSVLVNKRVHF